MDKEKILLFVGDGGHSIVSKSILDHQYKKFKRIKFYFPLNRENIIKNKKKFNSFFIKNSKHRIVIFIAIGFNYHRKVISQFLDNNFKKRFSYLTIISKNSIIANNVKIGKGSIVMPGVTINTDSNIGNHSIINTNASIDHHNKLGNFVSIAPGVSTGGNVVIGSCSHIGIGSSIKHNISIKNNVVIGGGSYVCKSCNANSLFYGSPTIFIKKRKINDTYL